MVTRDYQDENMVTGDDRDDNMIPRNAQDDNMVTRDDQDDNIVTRDEQDDNMVKRKILACHIGIGMSIFNLRNSNASENPDQFLCSISYHQMDKN